MILLKIQERLDDQQSSETLGKARHQSGVAAELKSWGGPDFNRAVARRLAEL